VHIHVATKVSVQAPHERIGEYGLFRHCPKYAWSSGVCVPSCWIHDAYRPRRRKGSAWPTSWGTRRGLALILIKPGPGACP